MTMAKRAYMILMIGLFFGAGHAVADAFPAPTDGQFEMIKYPNGYGCGLFAENQSQKGKGWFISGSSVSTEADCRKSCEAQISKAQAEYRGKKMSVAGTCFNGKKALFTIPLAESDK